MRSPSPERKERKMKKMRKMRNKQYSCQNHVVLGPALYNYIYKKENVTFASFFFPPLYI